MKCEWKCRRTSAKRTNIRREKEEKSTRIVHRGLDVISSKNYICQLFTFRAARTWRETVAKKKKKRWTNDRTMKWWSLDVMFFVFILSSSTTINFIRRQADASLADMEGKETDRQKEKKSVSSIREGKKRRNQIFSSPIEKNASFLHRQRKLTHLCTWVNALQRHQLPKKRSNQWHQHGWRNVDDLRQVCCTRSTERKISSPDLFFFLLIINEIHSCSFLWDGRMLYLLTLAHAVAMAASLHSSRFVFAGLPSCKLE